MSAIGRAQVDQLVDVVFNTWLAQDRVCHQGCSHTADRQPIRACDSINMVSSLTPASRRHVLNDDVWASGNIFAQKRSHGPRPQIRRSRRRTAQNNSNRFVLIEGDLSQGQPGVHSENRDEQNDDIHFHIFRSLVVFRQITEHAYIHLCKT